MFIRFLSLAVQARPGKAPYLQGKMNCYPSHMAVMDSLAQWRILIVCTHILNVSSKIEASSNYLSLTASGTATGGCCEQGSLVHKPATWLEWDPSAVQLAIPFTQAFISLLSKTNPRAKGSIPDYVMSPQKSFKESKRGSATGPVSITDIHLNTKLQVSSCGPTTPRSRKQHCLRSKNLEYKGPLGGRLSGSWWATSSSGCTYCTGCSSRGPETNFPAPTWQLTTVPEDLTPLLASEGNR